MLSEMLLLSEWVGNKKIKSHLIITNITNTTIILGDVVMFSIVVNVVILFLKIT